MIAAAGFAFLFAVTLVWCMCRAASSRTPKPPEKPEPAPRRALMALAAFAGGWKK